MNLYTKQRNRQERKTKHLANIARHKLNMRVEFLPGKRHLIHTGGAMP